MTKLLYLIPDYKWFISHRLHLAKAAAQQGFTVFVATSSDSMRQLPGIKIIQLKYFYRGLGINVFREILSLFEIYSIYKKYNPDIVHHVALKMVLYGSLIAKFVPIKKRINAITGLGYIFSNHKKINILRMVVCFIMRVLLTNSTIIFQNNHNLQILREHNCIHNTKSVLIRGSGVDPNKFTYTTEPIDIPITIVLAARMLWAKGVKEFVEAAGILKNVYHEKIIFRMYGDPDQCNPSAVPLEFLESLNKDNIVAWEGYCNNMQDIYAKSHIVVLPSYNEGLPKTLLEAASCSRPIVTTDIPGCNDIVQHNVNGLLVTQKNVKELVDAIDKLVLDKDLRINMGKNGRQRVIDNFSEAIIQQQTLGLYNV